MATLKAIPTFEIQGLTKNEAIKALIIEHDLEPSEADKYWSEFGAKKSKRGFLDGLIETLIEGDLDEKGVLAYIESEGSANNLKDKGFYLKIAAFGTNLRKEVG